MSRRSKQRCGAAGVGEFLQFAAGALELEVGAFLFVVGELEADGRGEFGEGEAQVVLARAAHLPASAAVFVGKGVGVFDGKRGLAQPADAVDGGDDADVTGLDEVLAQHPQIGGAADEMRVVRVHVAETFLGAFASHDGIGNLAIELAYAFLHGSFAQGFFALVMPWAQVEVLALAQFCHPRGALLLEILAVPARHFNKVNWRYAIEPMQMADLVFEVFDELPLAIVALEIRRRKTREQQARFAKSLKDALTPVLHPVDFLLVEERHKFALRKGSEVSLDALDKLRDAALLIVTARIGNEEVVRHRSLLPSILCARPRQAAP